ncbi:MAG: class I SAM-dependent methyltransferase [Chloroflexi bacterium]|nr:class I SAM-dependent methyltransferase [Chloroflexota bacterium]
MPADYDAVADQYDATFQALPYRIFVEEWSVLNALGDVDRRSVLELATGTGHYARRLRRLGASRVVAVDLSAEMIALAQEAENRTPLGISYRVDDVTTLELDETFDVVVAVYLLHYAADIDRLDAMARVIAHHLKPGGRFVTFQLNPSLAREDHYYEPYGMRVNLPRRYSDGQELSFSVQVGGDWWAPISVHYWTRETLTASLQRAGLTDIRWQDPTLDPQGAARHGEDYWKAYFEHPHCVVIEATRGS